MKSLAAALVVLSGALLWGIGAICWTWSYASGGNIGSAQNAQYGGMAVIAFGVVFLVRAFKES